MSKNNDRELEDGQDRLPHLMRIDALAEVLGVSVRASPPSAGTGAADPLPEGGPLRHVRREGDRHLAGGVPAPSRGQSPVGVEPEGFSGFERAREGPHHCGLNAFRAP